MSRSKLSAVRRWVDAGDHGDTPGLGALLDPQDVEGQRNREWRRTGLGASGAAPETVAALDEVTPRAASVGSACLPRKDVPAESMDVAATSRPHGTPGRRAVVGGVS
jgi:hypothetical protein